MLYLPISLNNACKKRYSAGLLTGDFPAAIDALSCNTETRIIGNLTRELNDCYCLNLPVTLSLLRGSESLLLEHGKGRLVLVGASHTSCMSSLLPASLATKLLKLPGQSQTKDGVSEILATITEMNLQKGDFVYLDLLSNASFMGTNENGLQVPPIKDSQKNWHVTGSLVACPKPQIKKILTLFESLCKSIGEAKLVCGLPLPRYVEERCCTDKGHIDNFGDSDYAEVFGQVCETAKSCLASAATIFDQQATFSGKEEEDVVFEELLSSGGLPI